MMFLTCHPALSRESRVALTLKIVGGFSVGEIARAFLADRRARSRSGWCARSGCCANATSPFGPPERAPTSPSGSTRCSRAIYLMFNEGYAATAGDALMREDIAAEAIRLARLVTRHPATAVPRAWALLALLLLHAARFRGAGELRGRAVPAARSGSERRGTGR